MNPKVFTIAKKVTSFVVGFGISKIIAGVVENNVSTEKITDKVAVTAGSYVLGFAISEQLSEYTDRQIDNVADWYDKNVTNRSK